MGLLDVNIPMLYGKGSKKAFHHSQLEIIRTWDDQSIFAWPRNTGNVRTDTILTSLPSNDNFKSLLTSVSIRLTNRYIVTSAIQHFPDLEHYNVQHCNAICLAPE